MAIGDLAIRLRANTAEFESDMGRAAHVMSREMEGMVTRANAVGNIIGQSITAIASHVSKLVGETLKMGDELNKLSQRTGFAVERLSEISVAAELADVSFSQLQSGLGAFNKALAEAQKEGSKTGEVFRALGVDVKAGGEKAFEQFKDAINSLPDGETKVAAMRAIFNKGGDAFIPMLSSLDEMSEKARKLGVVMSKELAADAEKFNDTLKLMSISGRALALNVLTPLSGAFTTIADNILRAKMRGDMWLQSLKEILKLQAALMSYIPGPMGWLADKAAKKLFEENAAEPEAAASTAVTDVDKGRLERAVANIKDKAERVKKAKDDSAREAREWEREMQRQIDVRRKIEDADLRASEYHAEEVRKFAEEQKSRKYYENIWGADAISGMSLEDLQKKFAATVQAATDMHEAWDKAGLAAAAFDENGKSLLDNAHKGVDVARELGLTFTSAFEDAVLHGKKFRDVLQGIAQDIARLLVRTTVTEPVSDALRGALKGGGGLGGLVRSLFGGGNASSAGGTADIAMMANDAGLVGSFASGTSYVPRTGLALVHQGEAIVPASQNHAGAGGVTVVIHQDNRGVDPSVIGRMEQANARLRRDIVPLVAGATRRGGAARRGIGG